MPPPPPPIARPDEITVALGGQADLYYYANDDLFGLEALRSSWAVGTCSGRVRAEPIVIQTGFATLHGQVLGTCVMNYTVGTSAGSASSTITIHVVPAP